MRCTQIGRHKINSIYDILAKNLKAVGDRYRSSSVEVCCTQTTVSCVSISFFLFLPVDHYGAEWHKFSGTINVHALVTIRWFVMQLRWYVPGIGIFALNGPSWREFKDENVSVYLIKRKDSNLSCSSKYPLHLWTFFVYTTFLQIILSYSRSIWC